jgi:fumarate hydratase subunit alpha
VRYVEFDKVVETVGSLCIAACHELPEDVYAALEQASKKESNPFAAKILDQLIRNADIAAREKIPLCQDTGLTVVFVEQGADVAIKASGGQTLTDAINQGVASGYEKGYLRKSVVAEPLKGRKNTGTNTPAIIHYSVVPGDRLKVTVMAKGGGCENRSAFEMFRPTAGPSEIVDWVVEVIQTAGADACPPFVVGVGMGGDFESCCLLSKKALLRRLDSRHPDEFYARLEKEMLSKINALGVGPQGFGGDTTALACLIETAPCHIASLPVAVNIECHSHRHKTAVL